MKILPLLLILFLTSCGRDTFITEGGTLQNAITVSGEGRVAIKPDVVVANLGVETHGTQLKEAVSQSNKKISAILEKIKNRGVDSRDIQTSFSVYPQYSHHQGGRQPSISGYTVSNQLTIKIKDIDQVDQILTEALNAGANSIQGLQWTVDNRKEALAKALKLAVDDARSKAKVLADAADVELGRASVIQQADVPIFARPQMMLEKSMVGDAASSVPVESGQVEVASQVTVQFKIEN